MSEHGLMGIFLTPGMLGRMFQPERIDPSASRQGYDVRSDVWSLGITLVGAREEIHTFDIGMAI